MPEKKTSSGATRFKTRLIVFAVALLAILVLRKPPDARQILLRAQTASLPGESRDYFVYWQTRFYQRSGPGQALALTILDTWLKIEDGNVVQSHAIERDSDTGTILFENIFDGRQRILYDSAGWLNAVPASNEAPIPYHSDIPFMEYARQAELTITGTEILDTGSETWVLKVEQTADLSKTLETYDETSKPYLNDLEIQAFHYKWLVDKDTERMVMFEWQAITPSGPVVLEHADYGLPLVINEDELPAHWLLPSILSTPGD